MLRNIKSKFINDLNIIFIMNALEVKNISKIYHGGVKAVDDISFVVEKGDFFALLGPNGAGKSTTIGMISSLVNKTSGNIRIFSKDLHKDEFEAKRYVGLVPQEFNFSVFVPAIEILEDQAGYFGIDGKTAKKRAEKYLRLLGLWEKRNEMARNLSGGMKRRLMIARALMHEPKLLILDEPTAGVDIEIRRSMWEFLTNLNKKEGITIILTTHYLEEAENLCKNIAIINKGKIIENTSMKNLLRKLDKETFVLDTKNEFRPDILKDAKFEYKVVDTTTLEVVIKKEDSINGVFDYLKNKKIEVLSMRNKTNRLEELFINMVEVKE